MARHLKLPDAPEALYYIVLPLLVTMLLVALAIVVTRSASGSDHLSPRPPAQRDNPSAAPLDLGEQLFLEQFYRGVGKDPASQQLTDWAVRKWFEDRRR